MIPEDQFREEIEYLKVRVSILENYISAIGIVAETSRTDMNILGPLKDSFSENIAEAPARRGNVEAILTMTKFIERFLAYDDLGQQVDAKTRDDARVALGRSRVES